MSNETQYIAINAVDLTIVCVAQAGRVLGHRCKYWLDIRRRAADDPQDLRCCRLLFQRLGEVTVARLQLLEQPHVLDGNDGLVGERLEQGHLPLREELSLEPAEADRPDGDPLSHQGNAQLRPTVILPRELAAERKLARLALQVSDVESTPFEHRPAVERFADHGHASHE